VGEGVGMWRCGEHAWFHDCGRCDQSGGRVERT
jgi:hypothetical protein